MAGQGAEQLAALSQARAEQELAVQWVQFGDGSEVSENRRKRCGSHVLGKVTGPPDVQHPGNFL